MKIYKTSPLPFQGQKRKFVKHFKEALTHFPSNATYIDLFGGSGLLSHTIKTTYPNANVIWNDYDNFAHRLALIPTTNEIIAQLRPIVANYLKGTRINEVKPTILEVLRQYPPKALDYITLSANLLFSGKYATTFEALAKDGFYAKVTQTPYNADGYLAGVERRQTDYRNLIIEFEHNPNTVFILDPPYLSTDISSYRGAQNWKLKDYLHIVKCLNAMPRYIYFGSNKGQLLDLFDFLANEYDLPSPFNHTTRVSVSTNVNYTSTYEDLMIFKY
ncbi:DNA adenine methylase [Capnocytophaga sp. G1920]|uniref:DNA adenine methylase n=1 Tax=Capnocytophaga sp. G1920 TaxID=3448875 RepID=UPI003EDBF707